MFTAFDHYQEFPQTDQAKMLKCAVSLVAFRNVVFVPKQGILLELRDYYLLFHVYFTRKTPKRFRKLSVIFLWELDFCHPYRPVRRLSITQILQRQIYTIAKKAIKFTYYPYTGMQPTMHHYISQVTSQDATVGSTNSTLSNNTVPLLLTSNSTFANFSSILLEETTSSTNSSLEGELTAEATSLFKTSRGSQEKSNKSVIVDFLQRDDAVSRGPTGEGKTALHFDSLLREFLLMAHQY